MLVQEHLMSDVWHLGGEVYSTATDENNLRDDPDDPSRQPLPAEMIPIPSRWFCLPTRVSFRLPVQARCSDDEPVSERLQQVRTR
jgi:hypothetical protein